MKTESLNSARGRWKAYWRALRVARRETFKMSLDLLMYGSGVIFVPAQGDPHHVRIQDFYWKGEAS